MIAKVATDSGKYTLEFQLSGLPRTTNGSHGHWRTKQAQVKALKARVFASCWHLRPDVPLSLARITLTRASSVEPDYDNLVISFKPVIDGLRQAGVIVDDKRKNVGRPEYLWEKCKPGDGHIKVKVEAA
jgi:Holliday junction resolvase RusA-like endonuclease